MEENKQEHQEQQQQEQEIEIDEEIYNTIKTEIESSFNEKLTQKENRIKELETKLQEANKTRKIIISSKTKEVEHIKEPKKKLDIFI